MCRRMSLCRTVRISCTVRGLRSCYGIRPRCLAFAALLLRRLVLVCVRRRRTMVMLRWILTRLWWNSRSLVTGRRRIRLLIWLVRRLSASRNIVCVLLFVSWVGDEGSVKPLAGRRGSRRGGKRKAMTTLTLTTSVLKL